VDHPLWSLISVREEQVVHEHPREACSMTN
jgi:hypothetical protein